MDKLPLSVEKIDGISEALRPFYTEKDGKFILKVDVPEPEDTTGLKNALASERKRAADLEKQVKKWGKLGKSEDEIAQLLSDLEEQERKKAEEAGDHAKILKQHQDKWAAKQAELEAELNAAKKSERTAIISHSVMASLTKEGATEEGADLLPDRLAARIVFETTKEGSRILKIMQADGETPMAGSGLEGSATIDDLVKEAKGKWPSLFKGSGQSGSGMQPNNGSAGGGAKPNWADIQGSDPASRKKRAEYVEKYGSPYAVAR